MKIRYPRHIAFVGVIFLFSLGSAFTLKAQVPSLPLPLQSPNSPSANQALAKKGIQNRAKQSRIKTLIRPSSKKNGQDAAAERKGAAGIVKQNAAFKRRQSEKRRLNSPERDNANDKAQFSPKSLSGKGPGNTVKNLSDSLFHARSNPLASYDTLLDRNSVTDHPLSPDSPLHRYAASYGEKLENEAEAQLNAHLQKAPPPLEKPLMNTLSTTNPLAGASLPDPALTDHYFKPVADQVLNGPLVDLKKLKQAHLPDPAPLQDGIKQMQTLKQKYQTLADSRKAKEATRKHSLKAYPFYKRLEVGIGAGIQSLKPFEADITPLLGYRISRVWTVGAGIILGANRSLKLSAPLAHSGINTAVANQRDSRSWVYWEGYQWYALYTLTSYLRLHAAYQYRRSPLETVADHPYSHQLLGGVSNELKLIRNVRLRSTVLYQLNRKDAYLNGFTSPFQVSVGIVGYFDQ